ncbi:carboxylate--amine ligase [Nafulsella turpanensis]|uniref:carboxylate--amine ligase n=1 Tax=Nafulsella turpanensis TaxID=1265690 RepID=UPI00034A91AE|nr:ATP-grasp domain-containing protein [Nafulsella turpanensis]
MIDRIILLGNHIQGLGVSRICDRLGLKVHLYNEDSLCVTRFSNSCKVFTRFKGEEDLLRQLLALKIRNKSALLMPTNDRFVGFLSDNYEQLSEKYALSVPKPEITDICFNKIKTYTRAKEMGIPIPESHFPKTEAEVEALKDKIEYPVIIKPAVMYKFYSKLGKKVYVCRNPRELVENYRLATQVIIPDEVIVQEFLAGGPTKLYSFGSFCSGDKVWGSFVANRIRQKPMDFGISTTFARTVVNPRIDELAKKFLTGIGYFGVSETEFMYDEKTGDFKLIEINPRTWKWHTISNSIGINLIGMLVDYLNNRELREQHNTVPDIAWTERLTDGYVVLTEAMKGRLNYKDFAQSMKYKKEYACFSWKDPLPGLMYVALSPYLLFSR